MARIPFNHDIDQEIVNQFDKLTEDLPGAKCEILEAALRAFNSLPEDFQYKLLSGKPENHQLCFDLLGALAIPSKPKKHARKA